ncbi:hypothetical protein AB0B66_10375 [Catellatospora sp. NPDC049111]|uniref:hypothetical protein n=1 Tax=Catellatospora sp. NPDC049111 TaxID=3155271 RepID=UPI0034060494
MTTTALTPPRPLLPAAVYDLDLSCGHRTTVTTAAAVPTVLACCHRLGYSPYLDSRGVRLPFPAVVVGIHRRADIATTAPQLTVIHRADRAAP